MKLTYLGTAAAEGLPAVFCNCDVCRAARKAGGREIRTRSQILIDGKLLIDFPMDTYMHSLCYGIDLSAVKGVLITHAHTDHCYPQEFILHGEPFAHGMTEPTVKVYGNSAVKKIFDFGIKAEMRPEIAPSVPFITTKPFDRFVCGGYNITALPAVHTKGEDCLIYAIEKDGVTALIFNDSGILPQSAYLRMAQLGLKFNLVSFDCTYGHARHGEGRHMGALDADGERSKMQSSGLLAQDAKFVLTHFSHNCKNTYAELCRIEKDFNFIVAYDGMAIEI